MSDYRESDRETVRLSEDAAHRVLARAIELERDRGAETTIADLREVAREAGISMHAFDSALREGAALVARAETGHRPARTEGLFSRLWHRLTHRGATTTLSQAVVANVATAVLFWLLTFFLTRFAQRIGWQAMEVTILVSCVLGVGLARVLRARVVAMGLLGFVAWQTAELSMHLLFGNQAVQGGPTHFAVMIAGLLGAVLGWRFGREVADYAPTTAETAAVDSSAGRAPDASSEPRPDDHLFGLRLGAVAPSN